MAKRLYKFYKYYISPLYASSCRYYPSCSEYAMLCLSYQIFPIAIINIVFRLLRCNQLFRGDFDYPKIRFNTKNALKGQKIDVFIWLVPIKKNKFLIIKRMKNNE